MTPEREKIIRDTWRVYGHQWPPNLTRFRAPAVVPIPCYVPSPDAASIRRIDVCEFTIEQGHRDFGQTRVERVVCEGIVLVERPAA
jgi:hypothetical protein